jgi:membrane fusion protein (multidrug efflux system)
MQSMKKTLIIALSSMALFSCGNEENKEEKKQAKPSLQSEAFVAKAVEFDNKFVTAATLLANEQVEVRAPISGQVLRINFKEGAKIRKGQSIVQLDDRSWKAQLRGLKAELDKSEKDYKRKQKLIVSGGSSEKDMEEVFAAIESLKSKISELNVNISLANVRAPFAGTIGMRDFSLGAYLKEADLISVLTETNELKVDFSLPSSYSTSLEVGKTITILVNGDSLKASIYAINPVIDVNSRTINARALLSLYDVKSVLPGTYAEVVVSTNFSDKAILIPTQSVVPEINNQVVYTYSNGKAKRNIVEIGSRNADMVHITKGINVGDTIITTGMLQIREGMDMILQTIN